MYKLEVSRAEYSAVNHISTSPPTPTFSTNTLWLSINHNPHTRAKNQGVENETTRGQEKKRPKWPGAGEDLTSTYMRNQLVDEIHTLKTNNGMIMDDLQ